ASGTDLTSYGRIISWPVQLDIRAEITLSVLATKWRQPLEQAIRAPRTNYKYCLQVYREGFENVSRKMFSLMTSLYLPNCEPTRVQQTPMCHLNLGNPMDVQERHITNRKFGGANYVLRAVNKGVPRPACFDWRGCYRAGFPFFQPRKHEINAKNPSSWISTEGSPYP
ncbi:hypothetical protein J6590_102219, partial [Homalodisca vitripennis]